MIREAKFADIPSIVALLEMQFRLTHYYRDGTVNIDELATKRLLLTAIQRHGKALEGGTFIQVAENAGLVCGVIVGTLTRVYSIGDRLMASDLFWTANSLVDPRDPEKLMRNFVEWAWACPVVAEVKIGVTKIIEDEPDRIGRMLKRMGMTDYGQMYRMEKAA